jgi:hypothetical protein
MSAAALNFSLELSGNAFGSSSQRGALLVLAAFLASFAFIRMSTRLMRSPKVTWWPGSVTTGDVHVHHLVFGIVLLMLAGFLEFAFRPHSPWQEVLAIGFGIGIGLTLDEFALWLHLDDVYWSEEGRRSIDAVVIAAILAGGVVLGFAPISEGDTDSVVAIALAMAWVLGLAALAALKGKYWSALVGMFIPLVSLVAAIRLAKPNSPWGRRRYAGRSRKLAAATARDERIRRRYRRWQELVGGRPAAGSADEA